MGVGAENARIKTAFKPPNRDKEVIRVNRPIANKSVELEIRALVSSFHTLSAL